METWVSAELGWKPSHRPCEPAIAVLCGRTIKMPSVDAYGKLMTNNSVDGQ